VQAINSFVQRLALDRHRITEFYDRVFVSACAPNFAVGNEAAPNFSSVYQWAVVFDRDIRQRDALFDLGSLAYVRQVQIILCRSDLAKAGNGETKKKRLKRDCFHIVAVTVPKFSILRYQIICGFQEYGLILADRRSMQKAAAIFALVISSEVETSLEIADTRVIRRIS
jgi:hypothetical protein